MQSVYDDLNQDALKAFETADQLAQWRTEDGIVRFVREVIGAKVHPYQEDILRAFVKHKKVAVRSPRGAGKTAVAAFIVLWAFACFPDDVKIPTTAASWRQLTKFLWPEIAKWARQARWHILDMEIRQNKEIFQQSLKAPGKEAFPVTSNRPDLIEGAHARYMFMIFDESKGIPNGIFEAAQGSLGGEGARGGAEAYALAISTPGTPSGWFYNIHSGRAGYRDWWTKHITKDECLTSGQFTERYVENMKEAWGDGSQQYQNYIEGNFAESGDDVVMPLKWLEAAVDRYDEIEIADAPLIYGIDPSDTGVDKTAIVGSRGLHFVDVEAYPRLDVMETAGKIIQKIGGDKRVRIGVDNIGVGAGLYHRLRELKYNVSAVDARTKTDATDHTGQRRFINLRAYLWWSMRDAIDPNSPLDKICLPDNIELVGDLATPHYEVMSDGKIRLEAKDRIRERLGASPDLADAAVICHYMRRRTNDIGIW